jgi:hypothetical protein
MLMEAIAEESSATKATAATNKATAATNKATATEAEVASPRQCASSIDLLQQLVLQLLFSFDS